MPGMTLRRFNHVLSLIVVALSLYIIIFPFIPQLTFWWQGMFSSDSGFIYQSQLDISEDENKKPIPDDNRLVIPRLRMDEPVNEGETTAVLSRGVWRRPNVATPSEPNNTVLVGHRFTYDGQAVFYHLDKLKIDDPIVVYWEGREYAYQVGEIKVVPATAVEIEAPSDDPKLTLYTCTPLWSAKDRLVIVAYLVEPEA